MGNNDSRTIFRDQIQSLVSEDIPHDRFEFWDMLFSVSISFADIFTMIPDADIATLWESRRENFIRIIDYCLSILEEVMGLNQISNEKMCAAGNAVKLLTRLAPVLVDESEIMWTEQPRGLKLLEIIMKLMFTSDYCLGKSGKPENEMGNIWGNGLGDSRNIEKISGTTWTNRYELLKLLLGLCSKELYYSSDTPSNNLYGIYLVSKANLHCPQLFKSILSVMANFNPMGHWKLPYSSYFNHEFQEKTIQISLQLLSLLTHIDTQESESTKLFENYGIDKTDLTQNFIKSQFARLSEQELSTLYNSFKSLIQIVVISQNTYLPGSVKDINCKQDLVIFFWNLLKNCPQFKKFLESRDDTYELVIPLMQMIESQDFVVTSSACYTLLELSMVRSFGSGLYRAFPSITSDLPLFTGNYSDFMIISYCKLIFQARSYYSSLTNYFLMTISNVSPYIRSLTPIAALGLTRLLEKYSIRPWLLETEKNNYCLFYILETLNNIIQYQWSAASTLILNLIRKKEMVHKLFALPEKWEESKSAENWLNKSWYEAWTQSLPLDTLKGLFAHIIPSLENYTKNNSKATDDDIIEFIKGITLVGLLPPPPRIITRLLEVSQGSENCEKIYLWAYIYLQSLPYPIVPKEKVKIVQFVEN